MRFARTALLALLTIPAIADTVTTRDNVGVNGKLIEMKDGTVRLEIHSSRGTETRYITIDKIATIEFNTATYNSAAPPRAFGMAPPPSSPEPVESAAIPGDLVVLRGNSRKDCRLVSITPDAVVCEGKGNQYSRVLVIRVQVVPR